MNKAESKEAEKFSVENLSFNLKERKKRITEEENRAIKLFTFVHTQKRKKSNKVFFFLQNSENNELRKQIKKTHLKQNQVFFMLSAKLVKRH